MGKYNEIKNNLKTKKEIQNIYLLENKRRENTRETIIIQMKQQWHLKKQIKKISDEKSWRKEILYSFFQRYNQCEIYINGILQNITNNEYYLNHTKTTNLDISKNESFLNHTQNINFATSKNEYYYYNISEIDDNSELSKLDYFSERLDSNKFINEYYLNLIFLKNNQA